MPTQGEIFDEIKEEAETRPSSFDIIRREYLEELQGYTGRDTILYSSGWTELDVHSPKFSITDTDVHGFMQTVNGLERNQLDLILHSPGGSSEVAEQIVTYLRRKFDNIRIFVPQMAMSAATLMCCAADEVVMGYHSSLGPTDPQLLIPREAGQRWVAAQSIIDQFDEVDEMAQKGEEIAQYYPILNQYDPGLLPDARQALRLSRRLAREWAKEYMFAGDKNADSKAETLANFLSSRDRSLSHNRRLSKEKVANQGMIVTELERDQDLQDLVLSVFHAAMITHSHRNTAKLIENQNGEIYNMEIQTPDTD